MVRHVRALRRFWATLAVAGVLNVTTPPLRVRASAPATVNAAQVQDSLLQDDVYILGPGDGLQLRLLAASDLSGPVDILNDGTAALPLLGNVVLSGLTLSQASQWLQLLYRDQLLRPDLQLSVVRPRPLRVAVIGEVERPGLYTLTTTETSATQASVTITGVSTLVDAIQKAGGVTGLANLRQVTLQRRIPGNPPRFKRARVDLLALVLEGDQLQNPVLFDGDTVRVERAQEEVAELAEVASTTLSPQAITVNVVGEVKAPGRIQVPANTPMMQAVLAAGGVEPWRARTSNLELVRINRNGTATRRSYTLDLNQGPSTLKNPPLREGDTVIVNRSRYAVTADAVEAVTRPLTGLVNVLALIQILDNTN
jgi:polysaccharide export outer membrane protein